MTREREMERKTNARIVVVVGASEGRAPLSPTPAYSDHVRDRIGCALPTAPSAKNRRQACPLRLANLTFVCLMFEIMLCAPATVDHVSFWLYLVKCLWYALLGWLRPLLVGEHRRLCAGLRLPRPPSLDGEHTTTSHSTCHPCSCVATSASASSARKYGPPHGVGGLESENP